MWIHTVFICLLLNPLYSQASQQLQLSFQPPSGQDGFHVNVNYTYSLVNCFGMPHITFGPRRVTATAYSYAGKVYYPQDFGQSQLDEPSTGLHHIEADLYHHNNKLNSLTFRNVISYPGLGCFAQSYDLFKDSSIDGKDYREKLNELSLRNVRLTFESSDYSLRNILRNKEKQANKPQVSASDIAATAPLSPPPVQKNTAAQARPQPSAKGTGPVSAKSGTLTQNQVNTNTPNSPSAATPTQNAQAPLTTAPPNSPQSNQQNVINQQQAMKSARKSADSFATAASGLLSSGVGLGFGFLQNMQQENHAMMSINFGGWDVLKTPPGQWGNFYGGLLTSFAFELGEQTPLSLPGGNQLDPKYRNIQRYGLDIRVLNNSFGWDVLMPFWSVGYYLGTEYADDLNEIDASKGQFVFGAGAALVVDDFVMSLGYNPSIDIVHFTFLFRM
jgi:hypothetical protein